MTRQQALVWGRAYALATVVAVPALGWAQATSGGVSDKPDTPFKLATFEAQNKVRLGLVLGDRVLDISGANQQLTKQAKLATVAIPAEMRALIEEYDRVKPRLYQIANYFKAANLDKATFAFAVASVSFKAPIKYPWEPAGGGGELQGPRRGNGRHPGRHRTGAGGRGNGRRAGPARGSRLRLRLREDSTPPPPRASCLTATRPSSSPSRRGPASSIRANLSTSSTGVSAQTTRWSWRSSWDRGRRTGCPGSRPTTTSSATA